jgi:hypothetical protein
MMGWEIEHRESTIRPSPSAGTLCSFGSDDSQSGRSMLLFWPCILTQLLALFAHCFVEVKL